MGKLSDTRENIEDITEPDESAGPKRSWTRVCLSPHGGRRRVFGLPLRWLLAIAIAATAIATIVSAVLGTILPRRAAGRVPPTGNYPTDAPFREVLRSNFPDPTLLRHNGTWYVYGTNNAAGILRSKLHGKSKGLGKANVQLATSSNLLNWTLHDQADDPLQVLGDWVSKKNMPAEADRSALVRRANVWAPDILQRPDGKFVLYYSATSANASHHCVGTAIGDIPTGPFESQSTPLACPVERGGAIDPASFTDSDGSIYVSYKVDGNAKGNGGQCGNSVPPLKDTPILLQKMERDGITPSGSPVKILDRTDEDGPLVEAPALFKSDEDIYFLFFSSGCTRNPSYDLKYATSMNITGPYMRASGELLKTGSYSLYAPGSASIWRDEQDWCMAFHARVYTDAGGIRAMYIANLKLNGTRAWLEVPS